MATHQKSSISFVGMLIIVALTLLISSEKTWGLSCENDVVGLVTQCKNYVVKEGTMLKPSEDCCAVVKKANVPCVCSLVTQQIESFISMAKVVYVAKSCGKDVPSGTKCGSYIVPRA
ncbi:Bifunctional inhibitor/lipid-transfer protein/seed storage 2S albumin superfamily protein [Euphorbia peplus]|nr:Bifunctional inhibitor/lipid-transfer protein/seed storage 2S albumin superfamily protein [Euphorbia peplus]